MPNLWTDHLGIWRDDESGPFGIAWNEVYRVTGFKLNGIKTEHVGIYLDLEFGEYFELYEEWPGFADAVAEFSQRFSQIDPHWLEQLRSLRLTDPPLQVWIRS